VLTRQEASGCSETVLGVLHDLSRIIPQFFDAMNYNALQIYYYVVPFLPITSKFYEVYQAEAAQSVKVLKGRENGWNPLICELKGHRESVDSARFSPNGKQIVTASGDNTARIWDSATGQTTFTLDGHTESVNSAQFSPNGRQIVTASYDNTARIWDPTTGQTVFTLDGHTYGVYSAQFSPNSKQIVTASYDNTARIWDSATGQTIFTLDGHTKSVTSAQFSPNGKQIVTASEDNTARIWDSATGQTIFTLSGHIDGVTSAQFSPNGKQIVTASYDHTARIWDSATGQTIFTLNGHTNWVESAQFSPNGKQIVTASYDNTARIWDSATGQHVDTFVSSKPVYSAKFIDEGHVLLSLKGGDHTWSLTSLLSQLDVTHPPSLAGRCVYTTVKVNALVGIYRDSVQPPESTVSSLFVCFIPYKFAFTDNYVCHDHILFIYGTGILILDLSPVLISPAC